MESEVYRCYPELISAAIHQRKYKTILRFWQFMIANSNTGNTCVGEFAFAFSMLFGLNERQLHRIISSGNGECWDYSPGSSKHNPGKIRVYSSNEVAHAFGLSSPGSYTERPVEEIVGRDSVARIYPVLIDYYESQHGSLTREKIFKLTGISIRSQHVYDTKKGNTSESNINPSPDIFGESSNDSQVRKNESIQG